MSTSKIYYSHHNVDYQKPNRTGYSEVDALSFLVGVKWDDVALGYVHALRPSGIRVTRGEATCDSRLWRVTVYVDKDNTIQRISQEVEVGLPDGVQHGSALRDALKWGLNSEQVVWHQDASGYVIDGINGKTYKTVKTLDGGDDMVQFPEGKSK